MATLFNGWGTSWGSAWGPLESDPNAMRGAASFSIHATITRNAGEMVGHASFAIVAGLDNRARPAPMGSGGIDEEEVDEYRVVLEKWIKAQQTRRREEDAIVLAIVNFVLEES